MIAQMSKANFLKIWHQIYRYNGYISNSIDRVETNIVGSMQLGEISVSQGILSGTKLGIRSIDIGTSIGKIVIVALPHRGHLGADFVDVTVTAPKMTEYESLALGDLVRKLFEAPTEDPHGFGEVFTKVLDRYIKGLTPRETPNIRYPVDAAIVAAGSIKIPAGCKRVGEALSVFGNVIFDGEVELGEAVTIGDNVTIGKAAKVGNGVLICGNVIIGAGAVIEDRVIVKEGAIITPGEIVGPKSPASYTATK